MPAPNCRNTGRLVVGGGGVVVGGTDAGCGCLRAPEAHSAVVAAAAVEALGSAVRNMRVLVVELVALRDSMRA